MAKLGKGLNRDANPVDQPEGTWRYAKNAVIKRDLGGISNEEGTDLGYDNPTVPLISPKALPNGYRAVGKIEVSSEIHIIFSYKESGSSSEIGFWDGKLYTTLFRTGGPLISYQIGTGEYIKISLNFNKNYLIRGMYKYNTANELIVYWTDNYNVPRYLNIDQQKKSTNVNWLYNKDYSNTTNTSYIDMLRIFPHTGPIPNIIKSEIGEGGACLAGTYQLALAYQDDYQTRTNYVTISSPVYIIDDTNLINSTYTDGVIPGSQTGKSILWEISNINTDYKYIKPVVIFRTGTNAPEVFELDLHETSLAPVALQGLPISFSGLENVSASSLQEVIVDYVAYDYVRSLTYLDHKAYLGNLKIDPVINYQKYANFIKLKPVAVDLEIFDPIDLGTAGLNDNVEVRDRQYNGVSFSQDTILNKYKGYKRGEVYAFYIAFIMKDGSMSRAFHIPGRPTDRELDEDWPDYVYNPASSVIETNTYLSGPSNWPPHAGTNTLNELTNNTTLKYEIFPYIHPEWKTNYWHNKDEYYPNSPDYDIVDAEKPNPTGGDIIPSLRNKNVRHHHFPKNQDENGQIHDLSLFPGSGGHVEPSTSTYSGGFTAVGLVQGFLSGQEIFYQANFGGFNYLHVPQSTANSLLDEGEAFGLVDIVVDGITYQRSYEWEDNCSISKMAGWLSSATDSCNNGLNTVFGTCRWIYLSSPIPIPACYAAGTCGCGDDYSEAVNTAPFNPTDFNQVFYFGNISVSWAMPVQNGTEAHHTVKPLGFELQDIKIPKSIGDKIQGFKIYYAKRTHEEKTVLGQSVALPMMSTNLFAYDTVSNKSSSAWITAPYGVDNSTHDRYGDNTTYALDGDDSDNSQDTYFPNHIVEGITFHDFGLLMNKNSITHAHYLDLQFSIDFIPLKGIHTWETDCGANHSVLESVFFWGGGYHNIASDGESKNHPYVIADAAKAYIPQRSIYKTEGEWGRDYIHNIGGESCIAMRLDTPLKKEASTYVDEDCAICDTKAEHAEVVDSYSTTGGNCASYYLYLTDLKTLKRNVYEGYDNRVLIDTGFQIIGSSLQKFLLDDDDDPVVSGSDFTTDTIFGGDITINRYGVRSTWDNYGSTLGGTDFGDGDGNRVMRGLYSIIVESSDNIDYRHTEGIGTAYFPRYTAKSLLGTLEGTCMVNPHSNCTDYEPCESLDLHGHSTQTHPGNVASGYSIATGSPEGIRYNPAYSLNNDIRYPLGYSKYFKQYTQFPNRVIRSIDDTSVTDGFRLFEAIEYKDVPKQRREITNLFTQNNLIFIQTADSIFKTQGKQTIETEQGGSAFIGSGDIFKQEPLELIQTDQGYGGNVFDYANLLTRYGYFWVNYKSSRIFLFTDKIEDISALGMSNWFEKNIPYLLSIDHYLTIPPDLPYSGMGFHATYDELNRRIILTKREKIFKDYAHKVALDRYFNTFINPNGIGYVLSDTTTLLRYNEEGKYYEYVNTYDEPNLGEFVPATWKKISWDSNSYFEPGNEWTISYQADYKVWVSFHDYIPDMYISSSEYMGSMAVMGEHCSWCGTTYGDQTIYLHNDPDYIGLFYGAATGNKVYQPKPFEIEFVDNQENESSKLYSSFYYVVDVHNHPLAVKGSAKTWDQGGASIHSMGFTSFYVYNRNQSTTEIDLQYLSNIRNSHNTWNVNSFRDEARSVQDSRHAGTTIYNDQTWVTSEVPPMDRGPVVSEGMNQTLSNSFTTTNKPWNERRRFIDKYLNIHLICNNSENLLVTLYSIGAKRRIAYR